MEGASSMRAHLTDDNIYFTTGNCSICQMKDFIYVCITEYYFIAWIAFHLYRQYTHTVSVVTVFASQGVMN